MTTYMARRVVTPEQVIENGWFQVIDDRFGTVGGHGQGMPADGQPPVDLGDVTVVPGFVDIHTHGGGGATYSTTDPEEVRRAAAFHARHGTTTTMASLVTASLETLTDQVACLADLVTDGVVAGVHLEGPFLSKARCGAHDPKLLRDPEPADVEKLLHESVRMVTIAPELPGGLAAIRQVVQANKVAALGHTDATYEQMVLGTDAGATVATHLFNGMRPFHHRDPGPAVAAINDDRLLLEVINDGFHLNPQTVRMTMRAAGTDRVALITDAMVATGLSDGRYKIGELDVDVVNGEARLTTPERSIAGSTLTMDVAFANAVNAGVSLLDASKMASATPAKTFGWYVGTIEQLCFADAVVLGPDLDVQKVMKRGEWLP